MLSKGETVELGEITCRVEEHVARGRVGDVYRVKEGEGNLYALKIARDRRGPTLMSLRDEESRTERLARAGLPFARIAARGRDYVLKEWVEGIRGDRWLGEWRKNGRPFPTPETLGLLNLFRRVMLNGLLARDLNPTNLIWSEGCWILVDSDNIRKKGFRRARLEILRAWAEEWADDSEEEKKFGKRLAYIPAPEAGIEGKRREL